MNSQIMFSGNNKKNVTNLISAEFAYLWHFMMHCELVTTRYILLRQVAHKEISSNKLLVEAIVQKFTNFET